MAGSVRRLVGVAIAVAALGAATAVFSSQRHQRREAARVQAQAEVDAELPKVAASLEALAVEVANTAERGANLDAIAQLLPEITTASDQEELANTFQHFEPEPWFQPYVQVGPHAFLLGTMPLFHTDAQLLPAFEALAPKAVVEGRATALRAEGGAVWLVGLGRSVKTNPQQQPVLLALAQKLTPQRLEAVATRHGVSVLVLPAGDPRQGVGAGDASALATLARRLTSMKVSPEPCCSQKALGKDLQLLVHRDPAPKLLAAEAEGSGLAVPLFGLTGLVALSVLFFTFRAPKVDEASAQLLRETAAQLKHSQEQLQRLSQHITAGADNALKVAPPEGFEATQASVQQSRYEVVAPLGEGGMARVAVAVVRGAEGFRRTFVVKRLRPELAANTEVVAQFIDEARLGASLVHSNIVPVFDFGRDADGYFLAQEYILGRDVDALITASREQLGRPLEPAVVSYLALEALKALGYAHTKLNDAGRAMGLVHRDVSPNNLMVSARGEVKLLDFGIVKSDDRASRTQAGVVKGNLFFMSPEQARALPVDPRSDLFSLGMVLFTALTGAPLYEGNNVYDLMRRAAEGLQPADLERVRQGCGPLTEVVLKALSTDPAQRFVDAPAFAAAVTAAGPSVTAAELQSLMERLFTQAFAEERQKFAVTT